MSIFWEMTSGGFPFSSLVGSTVAACCVSIQLAAEPPSGPRCRWQFCGIVLGSCHEEQFLFIVDAKEYFFMISTAPRFWQPLVRCRSGVQDMVFSGRSLPETFPYSALFGSTVDTCLRQLTSFFFAQGCWHARCYATVWM